MRVSRGKLSGKETGSLFSINGRILRSKFICVVMLILLLTILSQVGLHFLGEYTEFVENVI